MKTLTSGQTFAVADVIPANTLLAETDYQQAVETIIAKGRIESCPARLCKKLVSCPYHGFVACVEAAFSDHRPLVLSPDHLWLLICQGFAQHVNAHAEALRSRLVSFTGTQTLVVIRDDFVKGAMENPWEEVFPEFAHQLRGFLGATVDLLNPSFTTTGSVETAACQIVLMETVKAYFNYEVWTRCGIPQITLEGTPEDWNRLRQKAQGLRAFELDWWIDPLTDVLDEFCKASQGQVDRGWWNSFFKIESASGGSYINGHILKLFPYLKGYQGEEATLRNPFPAADGSTYEGITQPRFPSGLAQVPFLWRYNEQQFQMEFLGGFVGIRQDAQTKSLRPEIGWAVRDKTQVEAGTANHVTPWWSETLGRILGGGQRPKEQ